MLFIVNIRNLLNRIYLESYIGDPDVILTTMDTKMNTTENPNNTTTTTQPSISTIAIKLPQIWENNVAS